ncbi:hypothetical protein HLB44_36320 [Aquincola sp. S2]|uniref:Uncharacterized protein n=1 Tax=Pseudaquabacterium terrae TaxID=2732868 RepID=A0ABX2EVH6_9BURK|nr:hypothetical protein [Aquabacterium terrae]
MREFIEFVANPGTKARPRVQNLPHGWSRHTATTASGTVATLDLMKSNGKILDVRAPLKPLIAFQRAFGASIAQPMARLQHPEHGHLSIARTFGESGNQGAATFRLRLDGPDGANELRHTMWRTRSNPAHGAGRRSATRTSNCLLACAGRASA